MEDEKKHNNLTIIGIILIIAVLTISVIIMAFPQTDEEETSNNQNNPDEDKPQLINLTTTEAYNLIQTASNLTVIDCRGLEGCSSCQFNRGHLPGAEMNINPRTLFNSSEDILVYSKNGSVGYDFCKQLVGNVSVNIKIYNLEGGYEAWVDTGYAVDKN